MQLARKFGQRLFTSVMHGPVAELYRGTVAEARAAGQGVRITLSLTDVPELGAIPWEYLYDEPNFLSISTWTPVVRYLDLPKPRKALAMQLPIRILGVVSAPTDAETLNGTLERAKLEEALKPLIATNAVSIEWLEEANLLALNRKLKNDDFHILHYIGHGGFDDTSGEGVLLFEDEFGRGRAVSGDQLGTILHDKIALRLVLLNSCEGARNSVKDPFSGVAASLVEREIPAVIGMQFEITDRAAVLFASEFYSMLAEGHPVDSAITEARLAIFADHNDVEWGTPVLFMRVADGRLFDVLDASAISRRDPEELASTAEAVIADATPVAVAEPPVAVAEPTVVAPPPVVVEPPPPVVVEPPPVVVEPPPPVVVQPPPPPVIVPPPIAVQPPPQPEPVPLAQPPIQPPRRRIPWRPIAIGGAAVLILLTAVGLLLPSTPAASIQVSTADTARTGLMIVTGTGFTPGETIDILLDGYPSATAIAGPDGSIRIPVAIGRARTGRVSAIGRSSKAQAALDYSAPTSGPSTAVLTNPPTDLPPTAIPPTQAPATTPPAPIVFGRGDILFYSNVEPGSSEKDYELYGLRPSTGDIQQLTSNNVEDMFPTWSPDYRRAAFSKTVNGSGDIYIMEAGRTERQLTSGPFDDFFPAWSRDGWIAFARIDPARPGSSIWLIREDGSGEQEALVGNILRSPAWSPDGTQLAITADMFKRDYDVTVIQGNGLPLLQITSGLTSDRNPSWSPDGRTIAFVSDRNKAGDADNDIYLLDYASGVVTRRLTDNDVQDGNPVWSPDGTQIAFYRKSADGFHIWVINADGSGERDLMPNGAGNNLDPQWR
jgi:outer membrane biosynthesis protein TonB